MTVLTVSRAVSVRPPPLRTVVGSGAGLVVAVVCAVGCVLLARNIAAGATAEDGTGFWPMQVVGTVAYGAVGTWLVVRGTAGLLGPLFLLVAFSLAAALCGREYGVHGMQVAGPLPADRWVFWSSTWVWVPGLLGLLLLVPLVLPDGVGLSRRWRAAVVAVAVTIVASTFSWAVMPYDRHDGPVLDAAIGPNPVVPPAAATALLDAVHGPLLALSVGLAVAALVVRFRRTDADQRRALAWVLYGVAVSMVCQVLVMLTDVVVPTALAVAALPVCCLVAVTRHRLWDLQLVVRRSLLYGGLTAAVAGAYAGVVGLVAGAVGVSTGAPVVATAVVAMLVLPLHHLLRRVVNRVVHGQSEDPYVTTARLARRLGSAVTPEQVTAVVLPEILAGVVRALPLRHLSLTMADGRTVAHGTALPSACGIELPLRHAGMAVGTLRASPVRGGLTRSERRALDDVAAQAAVAVHGVLVTADLQRERRRVVAAREEERRRLRRELHDGVGTALAAAGLAVETACDLVVERPAEGRALLVRLGAQLRVVVADVRAVTRDLRPAMLDELGLTGALRELGARSDCPDRPVDVEVAELGAVPAAVEVAAYLVVAELVSNACRHSAASRVRLAVRRQGGELRLRVSDDGRGIAPGAPAGVGLDSVRRRVEEVGGEVARVPGPGTTVDVRLPLDPR